MLAVKFYEDMKDELLRFAVVIAKHDGKWVFCKHKERETLEFPGGHRETGELILETAKRELMEETGAVKFEIRPICVYSVTGKTRVNETGEESFGGLFYAEIASFGEIHSEMEKIVLCDALPENGPQPPKRIMTEKTDRSDPVCFSLISGFPARRQPPHGGWAPCLWSRW